MSLTETESAIETQTETAPPPPLRVSLTELERVESEVDHQHCLVCYSDLTHPGILPCNHNEICGVCHLRLRHLHGNKKCPICKEEHEKIIVDVPDKQFDEYPIWGDELGSNYVFRQNVGMFFPKDYYDTDIEPLFGYQCTEPGCPYDGTVPDPTPEEEAEAEAANGDGNNNNSNNKKRKKKKKPPTPLRSLQDHLRVKHRLTLCQLCVDHKRDFVARLPRMAPYQLKKHLTKGDGPGSGFEGHPVCEFCRPKRFYDLTHLHIHLQKEHYKCHVCEKQGKPNQYFRNYQSLEKHFDRAHFLCHDVQCLQARFVVFENEIDLQAHMRQVHGLSTAAGSSKIQLEFRTRRTGYDGQGLEQPRQEVPSDEDFNYGLQGEAFVPAALPQTDDLTLHPMHLRRTAELRAQAAQIREQQEQQNQVASFPTLQAATAGTETEAGAGQQPLNIGWASGTTVQRVAGRKKNAGQVTETDFPALPSSGPPKSAATAKLRAGAPPASNRQFAAMQATAAQPTARAPASGGGGWGAASRPSAPTATAVATPPEPASYQYDNSAFPPVAAAPASYQYGGNAFPPVVAAPAPVNRQENLAADNFPALGGGKKKTAPKFAAATNLAKKFQSPQAAAPSWNSALPGTSTNNSSGPPAPRPNPPAPRQNVPSLKSEQDFPTPDSFPSLEGGTKKAAPKFAANVTKKHQSPQPPPSWNNTLEFPAPPTSSSSATKRAPAASQVAQAPRAAAPSLSNQMDFPAPPGASNKSSMKQRVIKDKKQPSQAAVANVLKAPQISVRPPANPQETLQEMQASLGPAKYKKLKRFTREFAGDDLAPDAFIDHAAALFDKGYGDPDFWKTIPALVSSMPNQASGNKALQYMESLRAIKAPSTVAPVLVSQPAPTSNSWGSNALDLKPESFPTPAMASAKPAPGRSAGTTSSAAPTTRYVVPSGGGGKKKNAWGGSAPAAVGQAKKTPGSVSAAASNQGPQGGSATKFMAQHTKQQAQQQQSQKVGQNAQNKKKNKKKEKDELRNLAFGR